MKIFFLFLILLCPFLADESMPTIENLKPVLDLTAPEALTLATDCTVSTAASFGDKKDTKCLKIEGSAKGWTFGECKPKTGAWEGYDYFEIGIFYTGNKPTSCAFIAKPAYGIPRSERHDLSVKIKPGENLIRIKIKGAKRNDGQLLDWSLPHFEWYFYKAQEKKDVSAELFLYKADLIKNNN